MKPNITSFLPSGCRNPRTEDNSPQTEANRTTVPVKVSSSMGEANLTIQSQVRIRPHARQTQLLEQFAGEKNDSTNEAICDTDLRNPSAETFGTNAGSPRQSTMNVQEKGEASTRNRLGTVPNILGGPLLKTLSHPHRMDIPSYENSMNAWEQKMKEHFGEEIWEDHSYYFQAAKKLFDNAKKSQPEIPRSRDKRGQIDEFEFPDLPDVFQHLPHLEEVDFRDWLKITSLPNSILHCEKLRKLAIPEDVTVPDGIALLPNMEMVNIEGLSHHTKLPSFVHQLDLSKVAIIGTPASMALINKLTERPLSIEVRTQLEGRIKTLTELASTLDAQNRDGKIDAESWEKAQQAAFEARTKRSNTLQEMGADTDSLVTNFKQAEQLIEDWRSRREPVTVVRLKEINGRIGAGGKHENVQPYGYGDKYGEFRRGMLGMGENLRLDPIYPHPKLISKLMEDLVTWIEQEKEKLHGSSDMLEKVQFATKAAQRFIGLHPFPDGNGRTMVQMLNWILRDFGLPPTALKKEDSCLMVLPGLGSQNPSQDSAVAAVVTGMERTISILNDEIASFHT